MVSITTKQIPQIQRHITTSIITHQILSDVQTKSSIRFTSLPNSLFLSLPPLNGRTCAGLCAHTLDSVTHQSWLNLYTYSQVRLSSHSVIFTCIRKHSSSRNPRASPVYCMSQLLPIGICAIFTIQLIFLLMRISNHLK